MKHHLTEKAATVEPGRMRRRTGPTLSERQRSATRHPIFQLQGTIGNQAVNRLLQSGMLQTKLAVSRSGDTPVQRQESDEAELLPSSDDALQMQPEAFTAPPVQHLNQTGLPDHLKSGIESLSGLSMDNVRVHYNSSQPAQLHALAYTQGTDIHVAPGQEKHLPHEAWHVVQQAQGRVHPTTQLKGGVPVNDDQGLEHEANMMGAKALAPAAQHHTVFSAVMVVGNRPEAVAQRELEDAVNHSPDLIGQQISIHANVNNPRVVVQRNQFESSFGAAHLRSDLGNVSCRPQGERLDIVFGHVAPGLRVVQRAGDYSGLLPEHETRSDSYTFGPQDKRTKEFTYHHIIPENELNDVFKKLKEILAQSETMASEQGIRLKQETEGLQAGARELWLDSRAKNTASAINAQFSDYEVDVTADQLRPLIKAHTSLDKLFPAIRDLIMRPLKLKLEQPFLSLRSSLSSRVSDLLKTPEFERHVTDGQITADVRDLVQDLSLKRIPLFKVAEVITIIIETPLSKRYDKIDKAEIVRRIQEYAKSKKFDLFYPEVYPELWQEKVGNSPSLKRIVRDKGLPREDQDELKDAIEWNPGNIHRGPKSSYRLNPAAGANFSALVDDGGDSFEQAAVNLVGTEHFAQLKALSRNIKVFLAANTDKPSEDMLTLATGLIAQMRTIQALGVTQFDETTWEKHGNANMRVKRNDERILEASGIKSIARLGRAAGIQGI